MHRALILIAQWIGIAHDRWRAAVSRGRPLVAQVDALQEELEKLRIESDLLRSRLLRLKGGSRPHYRNWERLAILWHRARYGLSLRTTARIFIVSGSTLSSWLQGTRRGARRLVEGREPLRGISGLAREIAWHLKREWPRWGTRRIAGILSRLGVKGSRSSVQRILRRRPPRPARQGRIPRSLPRPKEPGHIYVIDFTRIGGIFRSIVVGAVMDLYSRKVLALRVSNDEPDTTFARSLLRSAIDRYGMPRVLVSDQGAQFTSRVFKTFLRTRRIHHRRGAIGRPGAPTLDRWWRTLKEEYARGLLVYSLRASVERKLIRYAAWYNEERPNSGLALRTPNDVFHDRPLRTQRRRKSGRLIVSFMDGDRRLPIFRLRRAA